MKCCVPCWTNAGAVCAVYLANALNSLVLLVTIGNNADRLQEVPAFRRSQNTAERSAALTYHPLTFCLQTSSASLICILCRRGPWYHQPADTNRKCEKPTRVCVVGTEQKPLFTPWMGGGMSGCACVSGGWRHMSHWAYLHRAVNRRLFWLHQIRSPAVCSFGGKVFFVSFFFQTSCHCHLLLN